MKVLVIGGVAAGTKAAAKLKREDGSAQVKILTKGQDISYAGCGLPYYVGGLIGTREELIVNSPEKYAGLTGAEVVTGCEVTAVNAAAHTVTARKDGQAFEESYDRLVIATAPSPSCPICRRRAAGRVLHAHAGRRRGPAFLCEGERLPPRRRGGRQLYRAGDRRKPDGARAFP